MKTKIKKVKAWAVLGFNSYTEAYMSKNDAVSSCRIQKSYNCGVDFKVVPCEIVYKIEGKIRA